MQQITNTTTTQASNDRSVLGVLRRLMPKRILRLSEAMPLAELQADRLLRLRGVTDIPVPIEVVTGLPHVIVAADSDLPVHAASGASHWDQTRRSWVISVNPEEPVTRQRFTVLHEYKHILDHYHPGIAELHPATVFEREPVEYVADYFAACVLMPKRVIKAAYYDGIQQPRDLAYHFDVSVRAIQVRLEQLGITRHRDEPVIQITAPGPRYRMQTYARHPIGVSHTNAVANAILSPTRRGVTL